MHSLAPSRAHAHRLPFNDSSYCAIRMQEMYLILKENLPVQGRTLHDLVSTLAVEFPQLVTSATEQFLLLICWPPSQITGQSDHSLHDFQWGPVYACFIYMYESSHLDYRRERNDCTVFLVKLPPPTCLTSPSHPVKYFAQGHNKRN